MKKPLTISDQGLFHAFLAEREGFEPSMRLYTPYSLSRGAPSATRSRLRLSKSVPDSGFSTQFRGLLLRQGNELNIARQAWETALLPVGLGPLNALFGTGNEVPPEVTRGI